MVSPPSRYRLGDFVRWTWNALVVPWRLGCLTHLGGRQTALFAAFNVLLATAIATLLSTWTYLLGKGFALGLSEMDLGHDDLPADSPLQVGVGLLVAFLLWGLLLSSLLSVCRIVARGLYGSDREGCQRAVRQARILAVWLPAWALLMLVANAALQEELRHPAAAIRARAQLRLDNPDDLRQLSARERFLSLIVIFPPLWSIGLRPPAGQGPRRHTRFVATAAVASWLSLWLVWRVLPWTFIIAWTG